jgi:hypothetical protein
MGRVIRADRSSAGACRREDIQGCWPWTTFISWRGGSHLPGGGGNYPQSRRHRFGVQRHYGGRPGPEWAAGDACGIDSPAAGVWTGFWHWPGSLNPWLGPGAKAEGPHARSKEVGAATLPNAGESGSCGGLPGRPPRGCQRLSWPTGPVGGFEGVCSGCFPGSAEDEVPMVLAKNAVPPMIVGTRQWPHRPKAQG